MGSSASKSGGGSGGNKDGAGAAAAGSVYPTDPRDQGSTSIQISPDLLNNLGRKSAETALSNSGQGRRQENLKTLDGQVSERIAAELRRLKQGEEDVKKEIELALAKENIDREKGDATRSSIILERDLEEIRKKIERHQSKKVPDKVVSARDNLLKCYQSHKDTSTTLDCWPQVIEFKAVVSKMEKESLSR